MEKVQLLKQAIDKELAKPPLQISVIGFIELLIEYAYHARASDVHLEPEEKDVKVRLRIDGVLQDAFDFAKEIQSEVITRIKVLSELKTDIHHIPQDGRFRARIGDLGEVDVRVSIAPTYYEENVVMRILAEIIALTPEDMGFTAEQTVLVNKAIKKPYGMILANGPTGSGKTTTLYTLIRQLNTKEVSIITIEDPIEYSITGITQIPLNVQAGLTFAAGLRSILRQDPNVIMVGEIRDSETANIAVNAALTGHLMLSTLHTNDAATTFPRLIDMGILPFLVASTVNVVISQRLVRVVCKACRKKRILSQEETESLSSIVSSVDVKEVYTAGEGCKECSNTGYRNRTGIHEVLEVNDTIRELITSRADANQIKQAAIKNGMKTMLEDGLMKAQKGITTIEEVLRIIYE